MEATIDGSHQTSFPTSYLLTAAACPLTHSARQVNGSGLWLFSRKPENPQALALMTEKLQSMGIDTSVLKPVAHAGCQYGAGDE